jgi:hypothetical protein
MKRLIGMLCLVASCLAGSTLYAGEPASSLSLIPKDAAGFVHVRVNDVWKHEAFAPVRDYLTKTEPMLLKEFEKQFGFLPSDVDTLTLIYPTITERTPVPPLIVVRTLKPYDKAKVITALHGMTQAQIRELDRNHGRFDRDPRFGPPPIPNAVPFPAPAAPDPPRLEKREFEPQCGDKEEPDDADPDPFAPPRPKPDLRARHYMLEFGDAHLYCLDEQTLVFLPPSGYGAHAEIMPYVIQLLRRQEKGLLDPALAQAAKNTVVIAMDAAAFSKVLPKKLSSQDEILLRPITMSKLAMLSLDLSKDLTGTFTFHTEKAEDAKKIEDAVHGSIAALKKAVPEWRNDAKRAMLPELATLFVNQIELAVNQLTVKQSDNLVTATTSLKADDTFLTALKAGVAQVKVARERTISQNNLKQIGLALHGYHDAQGRLPFPGVAKFGAPLGPGNNNPNLSWRVAILPYIEQGPLYQQFKLDEPWDSEHNKRLIDKMPKVFAAVNGVKAEKGHTFYQIFTGREALKSGMTLLNATDGTSNTLMVVESGDSVPWTRPEDMLYDSKKPLPKLGAFFNGDFNALFMDGSVRYVRKGIDEKILRALITPSGGEVVPDWDK